MPDTTSSHAASGRGWGYAGALLGGLVSIAANVAHSYVPRPGPRPTGVRRWATWSGRCSGRFKAAPSLDLPAWDRAVHREEKDYNIWLSTQRSGYVNLDRDNVHVGMHKYGGVEICDQLAPDNTLVLVKRAVSAKELSHLCQAVVAARTLVGMHEARAAFAHVVERAGASIGRTIAPDFIPKKMVFAILHEQGRRLAPETLFPFALVTLVQTAAYLEALGIEVEVIGISPADRSPSNADRESA